jgi:hypothetical protein
VGCVCPWACYMNLWILCVSKPPKCPLICLADLAGDPTQVNVNMSMTTNKPPRGPSCASVQCGQCAHAPGVLFGDHDYVLPLEVRMANGPCFSVPACAWAARTNCLSRKSPCKQSSKVRQSWTTSMNAE